MPPNYTPRRAVILGETHGHQIAEASSTPYHKHTQPPRRSRSSLGTKQKLHMVPRAQHGKYYCLTQTQHHHVFSITCTVSKQVGLSSLDDDRQSKGRQYEAEGNETKALKNESKGDCDVASHLRAGVKVVCPTLKVRYPSHNIWRQPHNVSRVGDVEPRASLEANLISPTHRSKLGPYRLGLLKRK